MNSVVPISTVRQVSNYVAMQPLIAAIVDVNDNLPKTSLPTESPGSVQQNTHLLPAVSIYDNYGRLVKSQDKGNLIAYA